METDVNGKSTCAPGCEQYEEFSYRDKVFVQYDFMTLGGKFFSIIEPTLQQCREARDKWLKSL